MLAAVALVPRLRRHARLVGVLAVLVAVAQVLVEGARWQLWPAYGAVGVAGLLAATGPRDAPASPRLTSVVALLGLLLGGAAAWVLPVPPLALADGPVGTVTWVLDDPGRDGPTPGSPRRVPAQAWYPTTAAAAEGLPRDRVTDVPAAFAGAAGPWLGVPPLLLRHVGLGTTSAHVGAAPSAPDGGLPVVLLSHGWGGFRKAQVVLAESLAARGHLVVALDHVGGSLASEFPDGRVVPIEPRLLPDGAPPAVYDAASTRLERLYVDDLLLALADLAATTAGTPATVADVADTERLVMAGHSTGGGAAVWACTEAPACDGVLGYDPWVEPLPRELVGAGLGVPLLSLRSEEWAGNDNDAVLAELHRATPTQWRLALPGTEHRDVTVLGLLSPLSAEIGLTGPLDARTTQRAAVDVAAAFLDVVLRGDGTARLTRPVAPLVADPVGAG